MNIFFSVYSLSSSTTIQIILIYVLFSPRYGSGVLEDNLVARVYTSYETEGHFLAFYTVLNCYIYLLAYVYSPSSTQVSDGSDIVPENLEIKKKFRKSSVTLALIVYYVSCRNSRFFVNYFLLAIYNLLFLKKQEKKSISLLSSTVYNSKK